MGPIAPWLIGLGSSVVDGLFSADQARRNRNFQERMSSTSYQRAVQDASKAGLNPIVAGLGSGASTPGGAMAESPNFGRGISTALAIKQAKADVELTHAQAAAANAAGQLSNVQAGDILKTQFGRMSLQEAQARVANLDADERKLMLPFLVDKVKAELEQTRNSAAAMKVGTLLDQLSVQGAINMEKFEKEIGTKGPWARLLLEVLRGAAQFRDRDNIHILKK